MKIAITGHTKGIGKSFEDHLRPRGHHIVGISASTGDNINRTAHTTKLVIPCDLFINNAQSGYAQTELLYSVWQAWKGQHKWIWVISTQMTTDPVDSTPDGQDDITMSRYRNQKISLEAAATQLSHKGSWPKISIIRPGAVATQSNFDPSEKSDVDEWTKAIIDAFTLNPKMQIREISLGHTTKGIPL